uniref:Core-2/I-branching beta-1,6-N-acetylglucosaminyltransferase family protein n=3 Tax=Cucumis melo TaxID=3656 RepID=A0A9I9DA43_CUCME
SQSSLAIGIPFSSSPSLSLHFSFSTAHTVAEFHESKLSQKPKFSISSSFSSSSSSSSTSLTIPDHNHHHFPHSQSPSFSRFSFNSSHFPPLRLVIPLPFPSMFSTPFVLSFSLLLSLPILFLLAPHFIPSRPQSIPIPPPDDHDDLFLFNRATAGSNPSNPSTFSHLSSSSNPKLKIAFLFLTNSDLHFAPLWIRFFPNSSDLYNVYVHADPSINITRPGGPFLGRFIVSKRTYRGSPTLISATRRLIATAMIDDPANAYFALLSQYCIPLHSFSYVYNSLFSSTTFDSTSTPSELTHLGVRIRFKSFIEIVSKERHLWKRYNARGRFTMMPEVPFEKFRVGSQFFVLTRKHALVVVNDRTLWRKFKIPCQSSDDCYPEEHYFPTLLSMRDLSGCTQYTLTRVNWTGTANGHPYTYRSSEVSPMLIHQLRKSNYSESYLFARKFTPDCLRPLMAIAKSVIFRD